MPKSKPKKVRRAGGRTAVKRRKRETKTALVKARVPRSMKNAVTSYAQSVGEVEAVVVREALAEYFARRGLLFDKTPLSARADIQR